MVLGNWESILGLLSGAKMGAEGEGGLLRREKEEASCRPFGGAGRSLMPVLLPFVPNAPHPHPAAAPPPQLLRRPGGWGKEASG